MSHMRKLNLIVAHTDIVNVISALIDLECVEPTDPVITLDPPELTDVLNREVMDLTPYEANFESITVLATQYTYYLTGWLPVELEPKLIPMLSKHMCAWEISELSSYDADNAPAMLKYPQFLAKIRSGGRRIFVPLSKSRYA